ncbi:YebC-like protein [Viridothelium virens]|uniref:YebC-like protein n=1 Tax=Viridothelium virens TaxID=1048519 RepID=A0A6A6H538_VIRVR|nr:YebC-like protein [Viridothelium virens]
MLSRSPRGVSSCLRVSSRDRHNVLQNTRRLSSYPPLQSGHNRWSTIKHDKGKNDAAKNKQRSTLANEIASTSKLHGPDPNSNPHLAAILGTAKKAGFPKASIEAAIARGQGISPSGATLESIMVEAMIPHSVAVVIDCQTDNKSRTLQEVRLSIKEHEGTVTPTSYLFTKASRIIFQAREDIHAETALETVLDLNVMDAFDDDEGRVIMLTELNETFAVTERLESQHGLQVGSCDIVWEPNKDTMVELGEETTLERLDHFMGELQEKFGVQAIYVNAAQGKISDTLWADFRQKFGQYRP